MQMNIYKADLPYMCAAAHVRDNSEEKLQKFLVCEAEDHHLVLHLRTGDKGACKAHLARFKS